MTDSNDTAPEQAAAPKRARKAGIDGMLLPELKQIASSLGLRTAGMRKGQIVEAIKAAQVGGSGGGRTAPAQDAAPAQETVQEPVREPVQGKGQDSAQETGPERPRRARQRAQEPEQPKQDQPKEDQPKQDQPKQDQPKQDQPKQDQPKQDQPKQDQPKQDQPKQEQPKQEQPKQDHPKQDQSNQGGSNNQGGGNQGGQSDDQDDDQGGSRRNRRRRGRDRNNQDRNTQGGGNQGGQGNQGSGNQDNRQDSRQDNRQDNRRDDRPERSPQGRGREPDLQILEDDVLTACAGILDLMDNYAFVRTSGYLPGVDDVYVSMSMVRKHGLRRGDAVVGMVRQPREGERKEKFNPLVRIDSVNGADPEIARQRVDFERMTPLHPTERLRMETGPQDLMGRKIDLAAPIGKGQRGLVVAPTKAGKTTVLQSIARAVTTNNPECHLMVVLVDERPEEVTDFERSIKGEVISSTFDRAPADHTVLAELAIERAKRLVELGLDVVVLLDGVTRLARAYHMASTASGRALPGGADSVALHPPKRFFGAARNVENGGSLTIIATVQVESGSAMDDVVFEEFEGTANMELRLRRELAEARLFPAIDLVRSGTRHEVMLLGEEELDIVDRLRRHLADRPLREAHALVDERLRGSATNLELLRSVQRELPTAR